MTSLLLNLTSSSESDRRCGACLSLCYESLLVIVPALRAAVCVISPGIDAWGLVYNFMKRVSSRSKSACRAAKRRRGLLASQQKEDDVSRMSLLPVDCRARNITHALELSCVQCKVASWPDCDAWRPKSMFDLYYKLQRIVEKAEWEAFALSLRQPLPVTFRYAGDAAQTEFRAEGERILERWAARGLGTRRLDLVDGWQLHLDKHSLRDASAGSEESIIREWLIQGTHEGKLVRQEVGFTLERENL